MSLHTNHGLMGFQPIYPKKKMMQHAVLDDLPEIVAIYNSTVASRGVTADTEPVTVSSKEEWFHSHHKGRPLLVEKDNGKVIAWVSFRNFYGRPAYKHTAEFSIYLHADYRGKGRGSQLLGEAIRHCASIDIHTLVAFVFSHNRASLSLLKKHGFREWGKLPGIAVMDGKPYSLTLLGLKVPSENV